MLQIKQNFWLIVLNQLNLCVFQFIYKLEITFLCIRLLSLSLYTMSCI